MCQTVTPTRVEWLVTMSFSTVNSILFPRWQMSAVDEEERDESAGNAWFWPVLEMTCVWLNNNISKPVYTLQEKHLRKNICADTENWFRCAIMNALCLRPVCFVLVFLPDIVSDTFWLHQTFRIFNGEKQRYLLANGNSDVDIYSNLYQIGYNFQNVQWCCWMTVQMIIIFLHGIRELCINERHGSVFTMYTWRSH